MSRSLEERVQQLEDERELRDLLARYSFNADLGRTKEYSELYTDDGAIDLRDMGLERYEGKDSILKDFISAPAAADVAGRSFHHAAPTVFHIDGDDATGEGFSTLLYLADDGSMAVVHANYSHWTFRREGGEWKIVERDIRLIGSPEASTMFRKSVR